MIKKILITVSLFVISFVTFAKISAVIFDCDGVLVDTEHMKFKAWEKALGKKGVNFTLEEYYPLTGLSSEAIMQSIAKQKNLSILLIEQSKLIIEKDKIYHEMQKDSVPVIKNAVVSLNNIILNKKKDNIKLGLASSASKKEILQNLKHININPDDFDFIASGVDDLKHIKDKEGTNKPKPYIYDLMAKKLNVKPEECIVFEDTNAGIIAGSLAGMRTYAVPNKFTKHHDFSLAKSVISFDNFDLKKLDS